MKNKYINFVISSGLYNIYCKFRKYDYYFAYKNNCSSLYDDIPLELLPYIDFYYYVKKYPRLIKICEKLYISHKGKVRRVRTRAYRMLFNDDGSLKQCLFLTLTFRDDVLASTSQKTRRTYVSRFLKEQTRDYVANIDFGDLRGREHYHSLYGSEFIVPTDWQYGTCHLEKVRSNPDKIAQYINKITYHSTKDSAGFLIYSR